MYGQATVSQTDLNNALQVAALQTDLLKCYASNSITK